MSEREQFEAWINNPHSLNRYACHPNQYENPHTQGAWEAWQHLKAGFKDAKKQLAEKDALLLEAYKLISNRIDVDYLDEKEAASLDRIVEALE